jgi:hypothetical protein
MNLTDVVVETNLHQVRICSLTDNIGLHKHNPLRYTLASHLLIGTLFITVLPVVKCRRDTLNVPLMGSHLTHLGRHMATHSIHSMGRILLLGNLQGPRRIVRTTDGSLLRIVPGIYHLDHLRPWVEVVVGIIIEISGGEGTQLADEGAVDSITDNNLVINCQ